MAISPNFAFLGVHDPQLVKIGTLAERYFQDDPVTCLIKLRQFGELLAQLVAANVGLYTNPDETEAKALEETELRQLAEELLEEAEVELQQKLAAIQSSTANKSSKLIQQTVSAANEAEQQIDLDDNETRRLLIDTKLREAGWEVDSDNLTYTKGTRPQKGKNLAIAEYPVNNGRADYAPDEVKIEVQQFNRRVITESFNRTVCEKLAQYIDPSFPEKTLIFCVTDDHADMVVNLLKEAFEKE
jgi:hypothetical protein